MKLKNRREFIAGAATWLGSFCLLGLSPITSVLAKVAKTPSPQADFSLNLAIIYASFHGSTAQMAEFMANKLKYDGVNVDLVSVKDKINFEKYNGIIMGAPIHRGEWMVEAVDYVKTHRKFLQEIPMAVFYSCMSKAKQPPSKSTLEELSSYQTAMSYLFPGMDQQRFGSFAGALDYKKCSFLTRLIMRSIMRKNKLEAGDYRDWEAIKKWLDSAKQEIISNIDQKSLLKTDDNK